MQSSYYPVAQWLHYDIIITATKRLATRLKQELLTVDPLNAPQIFALQDWYGVLWSELEICSIAPQPRLLSPLEEHLLWRRRVYQSQEQLELIALPSVVRSAAQLSAQCAEWGFDPNEVTGYDDSIDWKLWRTWQAQYRHDIEKGGWLSHNQLPDQMITAWGMGTLPLPKSIFFTGFEEFTPKAQQVVETLKQFGVAVVCDETPMAKADIYQIPCLDQQEEWLKAAQWVKARYAKNPELRMAVIVPNLQQTRAEVVAVFQSVFDPTHLLRFEHKAIPIYNISGGIPLSMEPVIATVLSCLSILEDEQSTEDLCAWLHSPFWGAEQSEGLRVHLAWMLQSQGGGRIAAEELHALLAPLFQTAAAEGCADADSLSTLFADKRNQPYRSFSAWLTLSQRLWQLLQWPGVRILDSREFQAVTQWQALLTDMTHSADLVGTLAWSEYLALVYEALTDRIFQTETADRTVEVLGLLEAGGQRFDALWVCGMSQDVWPPPCAPSPFLPKDLQRKLDMPHATPERELRIAQQTMRHWAAAVDCLIYSYPRMDQDRLLAPTMLIAGYPLYTGQDLKSVKDQEDVEGNQKGVVPGVEKLIATPQLIPRPDGPCPLGGYEKDRAYSYSALQDQALCGFRAFAKHRLGVRPLAMMATEITPQLRGMLLHECLALLSQRETNPKQWCLVEEGVLLDIAKAACDQYCPRVPKLLLEVEQKILVNAIMAWSNLEASPSAGQAHIVLVETKAEAVCQGMRFNLRIDRLDQVTGNDFRLLDYKSRKPRLMDWFEARLMSPQMPLYVLALNQPIRSMLIGVVDSQGCSWSGIRGTDTGVEIIDSQKAPVLMQDQSWDGLLDQWRTQIDALVTEFQSGEAKVHPHSSTACRSCSVQPLCRIAEKDLLL